MASTQKGIAVRMDRNLAPQVGFEPTTLRLTAEIHSFYFNLPGLADTC